jgi:ethanolamine ammonia-lyase small subunit
MSKPPRLVQADPWQHLRQWTRARIALGRSGASLPTAEVLRFGLAHALARDAVHFPFEADDMQAALTENGFRVLSAHSAAADRRSYLLRPDLGRRLDEDSRLHLQQADPAPELALVVADGLSAPAVHAHALPVLDRLRPLLDADWEQTPVVVASQGRVALGDEIAVALRARIVAVLIGERPGLSSTDSLGIYLTWAPRVGSMDSERNCISNIRPDGLGYDEAARQLAGLIMLARRLRMTGVRLSANPGAEPLEA